MSNTTFDYGNDTVIVTGSSSGIGRATALGFAEAGATTICADIVTKPKDKDAEVPTHEMIREQGGDVEFVETNVADPEQVASVVEAARAYGGVDVMINNAGIAGGDTILEGTPEELDTMYDVNVKGVYAGVQAAAEDMIDRDDPGVILNTASISSDLAQGGSSAYEATKGAVRMITRGAALELGEYGIRVNAAAPGQIATEISEGWTERAKEGARADEHLKPIPLGRAGRPADVANAFLFLASEKAAYVTGELLHVDGGWQIC